MYNILFEPITSYVVYSLIFIKIITGIYFVDSKDMEDASIGLDLSFKSLIFIIILMFFICIFL